MKNINCWITIKCKYNDYIKIFLAVNIYIKRLKII